MTGSMFRNVPARLARIAFIAAAAMAVVIPPATARAVGPSHWVHTTEADFNNGRFSNVVATNFGDLKLSRSIKTLLEQDSRISAVYALAQTSDGTVYAATGPQGVLLRIKDDSVKDAAKLADGVSIFSLAVDHQDRILIGTGGETGRVLRMDKDGAEPKEIFKADGVQYIWAMQCLPDGTLYVATGPNGQLFEVKPDGTQQTLLDSNENNLLSLVTDGKDTLYVGTDPHGLVYRVNRKTRDIFVVHDAAESEISTLALAPDGTLYAGTGEALEGAGISPDLEQASPGGRPEGGTGAMPIPSQPPEEPQPPAPPDPNPGEPEPIPKTSALDSPQSLHPLAADLQVQDRPMLKPVALLLADGTPRQADEDPPDQAPNQGQAPIPGSEPAAATTPAAPMPPDIMSSESGEPRAGGNAIYRIDPAGFVTEVFREPVLVLSIIENNGILTVGTGSEGRVYQVNPKAEETLVLAKVEPKQVMCLLPTKDGRVLMGLANTGGIAAMTSGYAASGTYTSPVLDATQISQFGLIHLLGRLPQGAELLVATRSGNLSEPQETGWSKWTEDAAASEYLKISSPAARFLQYRLTFKSAEGKQSAVVDEADVAYQVPNQSPQVKSITASNAESAEGVANAVAAAVAAGGNGTITHGPPTSHGSGKQTITWEAFDPNGDALHYSLYFRSGSRAPWIMLKEDLTDATYEWDTRTVADGRYEVKVIASDALANPAGTGKSAARVSDPIVVDNTAPVIGDLKTSVDGANVTIAFDTVDRTSPLHSFEYSLDSSSDWQAVLPSDNICDGPEERVSLSLKGLKSGLHQISVRATDARGNQSIQAVSVTIK